MFGMFISMFTHPVDPSAISVSCSFWIVHVSAWGTASHGQAVSAHRCTIFHAECKSSSKGFTKPNAQDARCTSASFFTALQSALRKVHALCTDFKNFLRVRVHKWYILRDWTLNPCTSSTNFKNLVHRNVSARLDPPNQSSHGADFCRKMREPRTAPTRRFMFPNPCPRGTANPSFLIYVGSARPWSDAGHAFACRLRSHR